MASILPKAATRYLKFAVPFIHSAAELLEDEGSNDPQGAEYKAGLGIDYAADVITALTSGQPVPLPPAGLFTAQQLSHAALQANASESAHATAEQTKAPADPPEGAGGD